MLPVNAVIVGLSRPFA